MRLALGDSSIIHLEGVNYSNCTVEFRVDKAGFWLNESMVQDFRPRCDQMSEAEKEQYLCIPFCRELIDRGMEKGDAVCSTLNAERDLLRKIVDVIRNVESREELEAVKPLVHADSLAVAFQVEVVWNEELDRVFCSKLPSKKHWFAIGKTSIIIDESEELVQRRQKWCDELPGFFDYFQGEQGAPFRASVLRGSTLGYLGRNSRQELLRALDFELRVRGNSTEACNRQSRLTPLQVEPTLVRGVWFD